MIVECTNCGTEFKKKPSEMSKSGNNFCSRKCMGEFSSKKINVNCGTCNREIERTPRDIEKTTTGSCYCSRKCTAIASNTVEVRGVIETINNYRTRAIKEYGESCNRCGYETYKKVLEVHHINHDRANNNIENLEVLCPTCHAVEHRIIHNGNKCKPVNEDTKIE